MGEKEPFFIKTLNNYGYMGAYPSDRVMKEFIDFAEDVSTPMLDVGAAYGVATLPCLEKGARVWANDLDKRHLEALQEKAQNQGLSNLKLLPGKFPDELTIEPESLRAALVARVLHFFTAEEIMRAAQTLYSWLRPGGKIFITAETPYLRNIQNFIPTYEKRKLNKTWPGWIEAFADLDQRKGTSLPRSMHLLDPDILKRVFESAGFRTQWCDFFARPEFPEDLQLDGRESVGYIGVKK